MKNMIRELRRERGWNQIQLAEKLGWSQVDVSRAENGKVPITDRKIQKLANIFGVRPSHILGENNIHEYADLIRLPKILKKNKDTATFGPDMVPILGHANGSSEAIMLNFDEPIGETMRHPRQINMQGAFALQVRGNSMSPKYEAAQKVFPLLNHFPKQQQGCIVEMKNGEAFIKVFIRETEKELIFKQYNPPKEWKRSKSEVKALHAIVGTSEE
jgi:phage repressor protein C with HTH and peptisase S24 domain